MENKFRLFGKFYNKSFNRGFPNIYKQELNLRARDAHGMRRETWLAAIDCNSCYYTKFVSYKDWYCIRNQYQ